MVNAFTNFEIPTAAIEAAAKAYYESKLERAVELAKNSAFNELPLDSIVQRIPKESDRSVAILLFSIVEDLLKVAFQRQTQFDDKVASKALYSNGGPLSSANNRILMAYSLKWFSKESLSAISIIRKIRNTFAHTYVCNSFDDEPVRALIYSLPEIESKLHKIVIEGLSPKKDFSCRETYLVRSIMCVVQFEDDLHLTPIAIAEGVGLGDLNRVYRERHGIRNNESIRKVLEWSFLENEGVI